MAAVAAWDHRPSADELLDARLARGWRPTATPTVEGLVVLGHASRLSGAVTHPNPP